jgi:misacylated tRNA(Ala) deacylase
VQGTGATERLWITEPERSTALARVSHVRGRTFALDRSLFAPTSRAHRHPQPHDQGTIWWDGEKRRLERVFERDGGLWHQLRGTVPSVGAELNCHLDSDRRRLASRAHTAMHLILAALWASGAPPLVADPEVKGGGNVRLDFAGPVPARTLASARAQAMAWIAADLSITRDHAVRGTESKFVQPQRFQPPDPYPGPATTLDVVRIDGVCAYPCDGTLVARTGKVGSIAIAEARGRNDGTFVVVAKVSAGR